MFLPHRGASKEYLQHMSLWRTGENYPIIMLSAKKFTKVQRAQLIRTMLIRATNVPRL